MVRSSNSLKVHSEFNGISPSTDRIYEPGEDVQLSKLFDAHHKVHCQDCDKTIVEYGDVKKKMYVGPVGLAWCESCFSSEEGYEVVAWEY